MRQPLFSDSPPIETYFVLLILILVNAIAFSANGDEPGDVRGCYVTYNGLTGNFLFEPFLKVKDKTSTSEDGEPEIWGFRTWNLEPPDKEGNTHPVNIRASRFLPADNKFHEVQAGKGKRKLRCPKGLW